MNEFPNDWRRTRLGDVLSFQPGYPFESRFFSTLPIGPRLVRNRDLRADDSIVYFTGSYLREYVLSSGDVLIGMDGDFTPRVWWQDGALLNQRVGRLRTCGAVNAAYMSYALVQPLRQLEGSIGATTVKHLSHGDIESMVMLLPSRAEQDAITDALVAADDLIGTLERLITKKLAMRQSMTHQLLTGKIRLPGFNARWQRATLGDASSINPESLSAGTDPAKLIDYISLEDVERGELLGYTQIRFDLAPSRARRVLREMDVLFGTVRPNLQAHTFYQGGLGCPIASTGFAVIRADNGQSDPYYLFYLLMSHLTTAQIDRIITGSNYPAVSSNDVRRLSFDFPPLAEQQAIGSALADCDAELSVLKERLSKTNVIKRGMMQELLTGRTRLPTAGATS